MIAILPKMPDTTISVETNRGLVKIKVTDSDGEKATGARIPHDPSIHDYSKILRLFADWLDRQ